MAEGYFYARDYVMNANDWVNNELTIKSLRASISSPAATSAVRF